MLPIKLTKLLLCVGKFEEHETKIPRISEINSTLQLSYSKAQILNLEKTILKYFNWKLTVPTSVHFAQYYLNFAICPQDICKNCCNFRYVYSVISCNVYDYLDNALEGKPYSKAVLKPLFYERILIIVIYFQMICWSVIRHRLSRPVVY